jgi:hypothetical protein
MMNDRDTLRTSPEVPAIEPVWEPLGFLWIDSSPACWREKANVKEQKGELARQLHRQVADGLDPLFVRATALPDLTVRHVGYCRLLREARELYVFGFYHGCVALCTVVAQRALKDSLKNRLRVVVRGAPVQLPEEAMKDLDRCGFHLLVDFLLDSDVLPEALKLTLRDLAEITNGCTAGGGAHPEDDARRAVVLLHKLLEVTVAENGSESPRFIPGSSSAKTPAK